AQHEHWHCIPILLDHGSEKDKICTQLQKIQRQYPTAFLPFPILEKPSIAEAFVCLVKKIALNHFYNTCGLYYFVKNTERSQIESLLVKLNEQLAQNISPENIAQTIKAAFVTIEKNITENSFLYLLMNNLNSLFFDAISMK
ncbi:MAG: hypothetical protein M3R00_03965, partial [Pseudomonadota bacterium]|nr:hypothetical protein [Pseudomonadota bacterium]